MAHYLLQCRDVEGGAALRAEHRADHLVHVRGSGAVRAAGGVLGEDEATIIGSWLVIETQDRAAAEAWSATDPFRQRGVYADVTITPIKMTYTDIKPATA